MFHVFLGHALHLHQPLWTANLGVEQYVGNAGMVVVEITPYCLAISKVAQINGEVADIAHPCSTVGKQCMDIVQQSRSLPLYVAGVEYLPLVVDAGRSRDIVDLTIGQCQTGTALKGYTVFMGWIEMVEGLEIRLSFCQLSSCCLMSAVCCSRLPCCCALKILY